MKIKGNYIKFYIQSLMYNSAFMFMSGTIIQGFMLEYAVSEQAVSVYASAMSLFQVIAVILISRYVEGFKNIPKSNAVSVGMQSILFLFLIFFSIATKTKATVVFAVLFVVSMISNIFRGAQSALEYKLPYHIIDMKDYGTISGLSLVFNSIAGISASSIMAFMITKMPYFKVMLFFFVFGLIALLTACIINLKYKPCNINNIQKNEITKKINIFKYKPFLILFVPNLLRGFCSGVLSVSLVIGYSCNVVGNADAGLMVTLVQLATVLGSLLYTALSQKISEKTILLFASISMSALMPMMFLSESKFMFFVLYSIIYLVIILVDISVPVAITKIVDYDCIGQYSAWRMALHTGGIALGSAVAVMMTNNLGGVLTMAIAGMCQFVSGVSYYIYIKNIHKHVKS